MEFFAYLGLFGIIVASGLVFTSIAVPATREIKHGRSALVLLAFFLPALFVAYLMIASHLRSEFHQGRSEANDFDGKITLPLGSGYYLRYFDEVPSQAYVERDVSGEFGTSFISPVRKIGFLDGHVLGAIGTSSLPDDSVDSYFLLDLPTGHLEKFKTESALWSRVGRTVPLVAADEAYWAAIKHQRSWLFWPTVVLAPFAIFLAIWRLRRSIRGSGSLLGNPTA